MAKKPHVVVQAIMALKCCDEKTVEDFLASEIEEATARGDKLTRTALLKEFRRDGCPTAPIIARLENKK